MLNKNEFIQNLHSFVATDLSIIQTIDFKKDLDRAEAIKKKLLYIYENWDKLERHSIGWKPTKKKR